MIRALAAAALLLAGCNVAPDEGEVAQLKSATAAVRARMKVPESALFKNVAAHGAAVCGEVNGSVGMGQTGYERFVVKDGKVTIASQLPTDAAMDAMWARDCAG